MTTDLENQPIEEPQPVVTVLMSVYNGERYLKQSIASVLAQTFADFEFLIVNDGSSDGSREIITAIRDSRIRLIDQPENRGLIASLNLGLSKARGRYIARHDADDLAAVDRLESQVEFMETHPNTVLLGSWLELIDKNGEVQGIWEYPVDAASTAWSLLFNSPTGHSSTMYRTAQAQEAGGYSPDYPLAEDYDLWSRLARVGTIQNLPRSLESYRVHTGGVSSSKNDHQETTRFQIARQNIETLIGTDLSDSILEILGDVRTAGDKAELLAATKAYRTLYSAHLDRYPAADFPTTEVQGDCEDRIRRNAEGLGLSARLSCLVDSAKFFGAGFWSRGRFLQFLITPRWRQQARRWLGLKRPPVLRV